MKFPAAWFAIKEGLSGTGKNYLTYEEYRKFCLEQGETEPDEQDKLAGFLHVLGIALNYREDPRLRYHHVLNPHWVTAGVCASIKRGNLPRRRGCSTSTTSRGSSTPPPRQGASREKITRARCTASCST